MGLNLKLFDTLGAVTLVTAPSMMNPEKISFTLINLKEQEKDQFAKQLNKIYPEDNVTVYIAKTNSDKSWLAQAMRKCKYIIVNKINLPIWIDEEIPSAKCYEVGPERSIEETFATFKTEMKTDV